MILPRKIFITLSQIKLNGAQPYAFYLMLGSTVLTILVNTLERLASFWDPSLGAAYTRLLPAGSTNRRAYAKTASRT